MKNIRNLKDLQNFPFPLVIMRKNISKEQFLENRKSILKIFFYTNIAFSIFFLMMDIVFKELLLTYNVILISIISGIVYIFSKYITNKNLSIFDKLPSICHFVSISQENISIFDNHGVLIQEFKVQDIKKIRSWHKSYGKGYSESGFYVIPKGKLFKKFVYNFTRQDPFLNAFYIEYQGEKYNVGDAIWIMNNIVDMLKQNPNAEHFPFRRKNYINHRKWDEP